jgi:hypothetical protein
MIGISRNHAPRGYSVSMLCVPCGRRASKRHSTGLRRNEHQKPEVTRHRLLGFEQIIRDEVTKLMKFAAKKDEPAEYI